LGFKVKKNSRVSQKLSFTKKKKKKKKKKKHTHSGAPAPSGTVLGEIIAGLCAADRAPEALRDWLPLAESAGVWIGAHAGSVVSKIPFLESSGCFICFILFLFSTPARLKWPAPPQNKKPDDTKIRGNN
jgi:hypothetical protein